MCRTGEEGVAIFFFLNSVTTEEEKLRGGLKALVSLKQMKGVATVNAFYISIIKKK